MTKFVFLRLTHEEALTNLSALRQLKRKAERDKARHPDFVPPPGGRDMNALRIKNSSAIIELIEAQLPPHEKDERSSLPSNCGPTALRYRVAAKDGSRWSWVVAASWDGRFAAYKTSDIRSEAGTFDADQCSALQHVLERDGFSVELELVEKEQQ